MSQAVNQLAAYVVGLLAVLAVGQLGLAAGFFLALRRFRRTLLPDERCSRAAVILCLRGGDPFLERCLMAILDQDYPRFELRVVVDHADDPALPIVEKAVGRQNSVPVIVQRLTDPLGTCSLKCSSLVQATTSCDDSIDFIAQLDADTIPHRSWLRELATALSHERVGAATGNRWYMPEQATWGALVRYAWNAAAVVQMYWYSIAWGGTLAIKTRVIRDLGLLDRWSRAFCEDTMLYRLLREKGWRTAFVPSLMMVNRETCDLGGFCRWVERQLLTARLYHPAWPAVVIHGALTTVAQCMALLLGLYAWMVGYGAMAAWLVASVIAYHASMLLMLILLERTVCRIASARGEATGRPSASRVGKIVLASGLTQVIYPWVLAIATQLRRVDWRGVTYDIAGPWDIRLVKYKPYQQKDSGSVPGSISL